MTIRATQKRILVIASFEVIECVESGVKKILKIFIVCLPLSHKYITFPNCVCVRARVLKRESRLALILCVRAFDEERERERERHYF